MMPIFLTSIIIGVGFLVLYSSDFIPIQNFGLFTTVGVFIALFADLIILPYLLLVTKNHLHKVGEIDRVKSMKLVVKFISCIFIIFLVSACESGDSDQSKTSPVIVDTNLQQPKTGRWYTVAQKEQGLKVFAKNCAACHGAQAQETVDWKTPTASGHYPPPPLNGTAHAWHHPLSVLQMVIRKGGKPLGGVMPAWENVLSDEEINAVIAAFQSYWPDQVYERWLEIDQQSQQ